MWWYIIYDLFRNTSFPCHDNSEIYYFFLQNIRSKFTFYADFSPGCDELRKKDTDGWFKEFDTLQDVIRKSADQAHQQGKLTDYERHQYYLSGTNVPPHR